MTHKASPAEPSQVGNGNVFSQLTKFVLFTVFFVIGANTNSVSAQDSVGEPNIFPNLSLGGFGGEVDSANPSEWSASYKLVEGSDEGVLEVEAVLSTDWHVYSTTQPPGGPYATSLKIEAPKGAKVSSAFRPDREPKKSVSDIYKGVTLEEFYDSVVWRAPIVVPPGFQGDIKVAVDALICKTIDPDAPDTVNAAEPGGCQPHTEVLVAKYKGAIATQLTAANDDAAPKPKPFRAKSSVVEWTVVGAKAIAPGGQTTIQFTAKPDKTYHVYAARVDDKNSATNFAVTNKSGLKVGTPTTSKKVISKPIAPGLPMMQHYHEGSVTWQLPIAVPADAKPGNYTVEGFVGYQACTANACLRPEALKFKAVITVGAARGQANPVEVETADRGDAMKAAGAKWVDDVKLISKAGAADAAVHPPAATRSHTSSTLPSRGGPVEDTASAVAAVEPTKRVAEDSPEAIAAMAKLYDANEKVKYLTLEDMDSNPVGSGGVSSAAGMTFWGAMFGAFVGGMILNLMPCVFPVLGLKVMGFVKQAGSDPAKIRMHGIAFAAGLLVAMWILAAIILTIKLSLGQDINWGAQMGNPYFVCAMIVLLFLLGLNMAGVFEFGTSMTRVGGGLQGKEGYSSSFFSGVLTTLIATPCSGPFLGAAMSYTLAQTAGVAMVLFTIFGLGIAFPYLVLCFFPVLINKLPRPGAWMETFKVTMAFALFATVAFFMQAFGNQTGPNGLSWLAMALVVIGLAAYYYGNWSAPHVPAQKRMWFGYALPLAIACLGGWMCYGAASEQVVSTASTHDAGGLEWQDWQPGKIEYSLANNKRPIWVDYTADW